MDRLQYHEFGHQLKLFKLLRADSSIESDEFQRRRQKDQLRDAKIKACTDELRSNNITVGGFLESLSVDAILPLEGKTYSYVRCTEKWTRISSLSSFSAKNFNFQNCDFSYSCFWNI